MKEFRLHRSVGFYGAWSDKAHVVGIPYLLLAIDPLPSEPDHPSPYLDHQNAGDRYHLPQITTRIFHDTRYMIVLMVDGLGAVVRCAARQSPRS